MTNNPAIILEGLKRCGFVNPDCDNCPFCTTEVHCRELELDAEKLIRSLLEKVSDYESTLVELNNRFSEGDFANGIRLLIETVERMEHKHEQD